MNAAAEARKRQSGREPMGVSFDKVDGATWLKFDIQPAANPTSVKERAAKLVDPGFGRVFTDHMVTIRWTEQDGWCDAQVRPRAPFQIDPASAVLHYAQEIFEGLKAYRVKNGVVLFRPERNARRFQASAERL